MANMAQRMSGANFQRPLRLVNGAQFDAVFRRGSRSADQWFTILYRDNQSGHARVGLALAKKRIRHATQRNRIKRLVRESFRRQRDNLPAVDLVVMARDAAAVASNAQLHGSLQRHWQRIAKDKQQGKHG